MHPFAVCWGGGCLLAGWGFCCPAAQSSRRVVAAPNVRNRCGARMTAACVHAILSNCACMGWGTSQVFYSFVYALSSLALCLLYYRGCCTQPARRKGWFQEGPGFCAYCASTVGCAAAWPCTVLVRFAGCHTRLSPLGQRSAFADPVLPDNRNLYTQTSACALVCCTLGLLHLGGFGVHSGCECEGHTAGGTRDRPHPCVMLWLSLCGCLGGMATDLSALPVLLMHWCTAPHVRLLLRSPFLLPFLCCCGFAMSCVVVAAAPSYYRSQQARKESCVHGRAIEALALRVCCWKKWLLLSATTRKSNTPAGLGPYASASTVHTLVAFAANCFAVVCRRLIYTRLHLPL